MKKYSSIDGDMAPEDLRQYCFILNSHELYEEIQQY
jgi:glucitol/sorbitol PTS system EIIA component